MYHHICHQSVSFGLRITTCFWPTFDSQSVVSRFAARNSYPRLQVIKNDSNDFGSKLALSISLQKYEEIWLL